MTQDNDEKRAKRLARLAKVGMSEEAFLRASRQFYIDVRELDAPEARRRFEALVGVSDGFQLEALPKVMQMFDDDAPVVSRGVRPCVFEVGMHAIAVAQDLYRGTRKAVDFGPVRVTRAARLDEVEGRAEQALAAVDERRRGEVLARAEADLAGRIRPDEQDRRAVRAYRILQLLGQIEYRVEEVDPATYLTPLQEEIFAGQVSREREPPCLRIGAKDHDRTLGWITLGADGRYVVDVSDHPLARRLSADLSLIFASEGKPTADTVPATYLKKLAGLLDGKYAVDVRL